MNISIYRTAKSLELVKVEVYGCFILCSYLYLHKTLILCNVPCNILRGLYTVSPLFSSKFSVLPRNLQSSNTSTDKKLD